MAGGLTHFWAKGAPFFVKPVLYRPGRHTGNNAEIGGFAALPALAKPITTGYETLHRVAFGVRVAIVVGKGQRQAPSGGHIILILLFAILVALSGLLTVPPLDRDESRFIQATTQMIETGDYVRIRYQDEERNKKPVGIYWIQSASVQLFADVEDRPLWAYRLPSLIAVALAGLFTYFAGCSLFGRSAAFLGAVLLVSAPVLAGEGSIAKTDATLLACVCAMQAALARLIVAREGRRVLRTAIAFWVAIGVGILVKGPIAPMIGVFTVGGMIAGSKLTGAGLSWLKRLRPVMGVAILALMVAPWAIAIGIVTDGRFYAEAVGTDMLGKITTGQERHGGPFGYHFIALWLMFWPAALFIPAAMRSAIPRWRDGAVLFCLSWLLPGFLVFELTSTKLPHYPMVLYPALALLIGAFLTSVKAGQFPLLRWAGALLYAFVGALAAFGIIYLAKTYSSEGVNAWHYTAAVVILGVTLVAASFSLRSKLIPALTSAVLASGIFAWVTFEGVLPTLDQLLLTPRLAEMLDRNEAHPLRDDTGPIALVGYHEPSAVFTLGTPTRLLTPQEAAVWIIAAQGRAVVVEDRERDAFLEALPAGRTAVAVDSLTGYNYSNSEDMRLTLYRLK
ncbi:glycosyltransferase family 39 protein [Parvularcula sp. LCG005]|uniref:ArnT family glycosyltransferase n=1 Tax=Parvularcula sp. LCG005 TaxID=3078805 RepID=UPI002943D6EF|nr:glycosyltransferase family 39 protein [Parvularcula sp. LCG005]WOI52726.1 glycosyltransferase family 39 protein [Parvularcula sp. LCG005]